METIDLTIDEYAEIVDALSQGFDARAMTDWMIRHAPRTFLNVRKECGAMRLPEGFTEVFTEMRAGKKIAAIKALRNLTGLGLKEAKDFVELDYAVAEVGGITYEKWSERVRSAGLHRTRRPGIAPPPEPPFYDFGIEVLRVVPETEITPEKVLEVMDRMGKGGDW